MLDDKLIEILLKWDKTSTNGLTEIPGATKEAIAQIKHAFADEGWVEPIEFKAWLLDRLAQYDQENIGWQYYDEVLEFLNNIPLPPDGKYGHLLVPMTGQEWYDRFEKEAKQLQQHQLVGQAWQLAFEAAKKASDL